MANPRIHLVLGDQLDHRSALFDAFDADRDVLWMAETVEEATHVWCHQLRLAFFFSAMRHFRDAQRDAGRTVRYHPIEEGAADFAAALQRDAEELGAEEFVVVEPGDHRVRAMLERAAEAAGARLEVLPDRHFYDSPAGFADFADGRKSLVLETYYRALRKRHGVLVDGDGEPEGGAWNYDKDNRESFGKGGPSGVPPLPRCAPDTVTREVMATVADRFGDHPGNLDHFDLPVTREDALAYLDDFVTRRLPDFGRYQDALWEGERFLYHSRLSALLNVKLLSPREAVDAAVAAYGQGAVPLNSVEGFVRQILGWREFVRGIYFLEGSGYLDRNALGAGEPLPAFYWDGETDMACVRDAMRNVIDHGYAHHIQRLMVLGLFALNLGVDPLAFHEWHMAMYLDAIDWASAPNTIGMSQYADGGIVGTKPYCASGNYISKMGNHCRGCRFDPKAATGDDACPFTTLYWDFLDRHHARLKGNRRMGFQVKNWERKGEAERAEITAAAEALKRRLREA